MMSTRPRWIAGVLALAFCLSAFCLSAGAQEKKSATVKILIPEKPAKTTLKIEGKEVPEPEGFKGGERTFTTPELEPNKSYAYSVEVTIEPNNYTKIVRKRDVTFKAGETVTVDVRKKDDKIADNVIIRWVPTPKIVVEDMCKLANVTEKDVCMDPGCGDGIMVVTAVKDFKAKKGVGTDLDKAKVAETLENAKKAGIEGKVVAYEANALKLTKKDLEDVSVMMLYMGDELNIRLRPSLWEHMKPGSRVVSHRFLMGDWAPDKSITVTREGDYGVEDFELHVWTITGKEKAGDYKKKVVEK
jgi:uncharacterized protein (TIGR03000 family)